MEAKKTIFFFEGENPTLNISLISKIEFWFPESELCFQLVIIIQITSYGFNLLL